jgi:hypothetical protein
MLTSNIRELGARSRTPSEDAVRRRRAVRSLDRARCARSIGLERQGVAAAQEKAEARLRDVADDLHSIAAEGLSLNAMAKRLNELDVKTSRGCAWTATAVRRAMLRLSTLDHTMISLLIVLLIAVAALSLVPKHFR